MTSVGLAADPGARQPHVSSMEGFAGEQAMHCVG